MFTALQLTDYWNALANERNDPYPDTYVRVAMAKMVGEYEFDPVQIAYGIHAYFAACQGHPSARQFADLNQLDDWILDDPLECSALLLEASGYVLPDAFANYVQFRADQGVPSARMFTIQELARKELEEWTRDNMERAAGDGRSIIARILSGGQRSVSKAPVARRQR